jgi:hypothetical protein
MPNGVDAAVKGVQPATRDAAFDRPRPEPERHELPPSDHAMLPSRQPRDHLVEWDGFAPYRGCRTNHSPIWCINL